MTIGAEEMERLTGISIRKLSYWHSKGIFTSDETTPGGHRRYSELDVARVRQMTVLREHGIGARNAGRVAMALGVGILDAVADPAELEVVVGRLRNWVDISYPEGVAFHADMREFMLGIAERLEAKA